MTTSLPPQLCRWQSHPSAAALQQAALAAVRTLAAEAIQQRGVFHIVLAGGNTPRQLYAALREQDCDWARWQIWFGDERCLPADHPERNSLMARQVWLDHVSLPLQHLHPIPAELGAERAARDYAHLLAQVPEFDLVLLGLGEDGHTASLFPGHDWGMTSASPAVLAVHHAPKPPPERVSLSAWRLAWSRRVLFLVTGSGKQQAVSAWRSGSALPAAAIRPACGVDILLEEALLSD